METGAIPEKANGVAVMGLAMNRDSKRMGRGPGNANLFGKSPRLFAVVSPAQRRRRQGRCKSIVEVATDDFGRLQAFQHLLLPRVDDRARQDMQLEGKKVKPSFRARATRQLMRRAGAKRE